MQRTRRIENRGNNNKNNLTHKESLKLSFFLTQSNQVETMLDLLDAAQFADFLQISRNHLYIQVRQARKTDEKHSMFYPALTVGKRHFFSTEKIFDQMEE